MIQLVVNTNLLREIDERKLLNTYAHLVYINDEDVSNDVKIKENLTYILNWEKSKDIGLKVYTDKFESIKKKDWEYLINFIKENHHEIKSLSYLSVKEKKLKSEEEIHDFIENKKQHKIDIFTDSNYKPTKKGRKAKSCFYENKEYKSRVECMYKENITKRKLYDYLKRTNQL